MQFDLKDVRCEPTNTGRNFYGCTYFAGKTELFYERTWTPTGFMTRQHRRQSPAEVLYDAFALIANPIENSEQWTNVGGTKAECDAIAARHPGAKAREQYYREGEFFIYFEDTDKALAFCQSDDFQPCQVNSEPDTFVT